MRFHILAFAVLTACSTDLDATPAPVATITPDFDPARPLATATVTFQLATTPADATLECRLGSAGFAPCASPLAITPGEGTFTLTVRATAGGVTEASPPSVTFAIDLTAPVVTIAAPADGATVGDDAGIAFAASEPAAFACAFDGAAETPCDSPLAIPATLANGPHAVAVRATDLAGNRGAAATVHFTLDRPALVVHIIPRLSECAGEVMRFVSLPGAAFTCTLDGKDLGPCPSQFVPPALTSGDHVLEVTATVGGHSASASIAFPIDTSPPTVQLALSPAPDAAGRTDPSGRVLFTTDRIVAATCALDDGAAHDCSVPRLDGAFSFVELSDAQPHTATVSVVDQCGDRASATLRFEVDSTPPAPCLTEANTDGGADIHGACLVAPTTGGAGALTFAGELGDYVCAISTVGLDGAPFRCFPGAPVPFSGLVDFGDGGHLYELVITAIDGHGNAARTYLPFVVDTTGPAVTLGAPAASPATGAVTIPYTVEADVTFPTCALDGIACACGPGAATCAAASAGAHVFTVAARDGFGNTGAAASAAVTMTYGPGGGRAILLGFDLQHPSDDGSALLAAALAEVPWRVTGTFARPLRALLYRGETPSGAESENVHNVLVDFADGSTSAALDDPDPARLAAALRGKDVFIVLDLNDAAAARDVGARWGASSVLRDFLDAGGVVIVLDGWSEVVGGVPVRSDTWQVLAGGDHPILAVDHAVASPTAGRVWSYLPTTAELVFGGASPLFAGATVAPADGAVSFRAVDHEQPRDVYSENDGGVPVIEKIFPVYDVAIEAGGVVTPGAAFTIDTTLADATTQCAVEVQSCRDEGGCCPSGDPAATRCACPAAGPDAFALPRRSGSYFIEGRVVGPDGRPGRIATSFATVP